MTRQINCNCMYVYTKTTWYTFNTHYTQLEAYIGKTLPFQWNAVLTEMDSKASWQELCFMAVLESLTSKTDLDRLRKIWLTNTKHTDWPRTQQIGLSYALDKLHYGCMCPLCCRSYQDHHPLCAPDRQHMLLFGWSYHVSICSLSLMPKEKSHKHPYALSGSSPHAPQS